jgi:Mrp family chromosome partitioning ATPase
VHPEFESQYRKKKTNKQNKKSTSSLKEARPAPALLVDSCLPGWGLSAHSSNSAPDYFLVRSLGFLQPSAHLTYL